MHTINVTFGIKKRKDSCEILLQCPDMYFTKMMTSVENLDGKSYEEIEDAIAERLSKLIPKIIQFASRTDSEHPYSSEMKAVCSIGEKKDEEVNRCRDFEAHIHQLIPKDMNASNLVQPISLPVYTWRCYLFGRGSAIVFNTTKETTPNAFHRFMQWLCFGNVWERILTK